MSTELAETPIMGRRFRPRWATTTATTTQNEFPDISVASQVTQSLVEGTHTYVAVAYARKKLHSLPPSVGRLLLFEGAPEQVGHVEDAIATSTLVPYLLAANSAWSALFSHSQYRSLLPSVLDGDEILNWDAAIEVAPERPFGTLLVTFKYAGRGRPTPVENPWDD